VFRGGNIVGMALVAYLGLTSMAGDDEPAPAPPAPHASPPAAQTLVQSPAVAVAQSTSCAGECQAEHDRCRVQTKGSPSCDAERQRCLEVCLKKKKR
jgi:hypothetical protein